MLTEAIYKERDAYGTYRRRVVMDDTSHVVSDERIKCDPVLVFDPPGPARIDAATGVATVVVSFELRDFDAELRTDSGTLHWCLLDGEREPAFTFTRQLDGGRAVLRFETAVPGEYSFALEPPFPVDLQLMDTLKVQVTW